MMNVLLFYRREMPITRCFLGTTAFLLLLICNVNVRSTTIVSIDLNKPCYKLNKFWTHTGFSPLGSSRDDTESLLFSKDEKINLALISALPNKAISHVRIHWLLNLVSLRGLEYDWSKLDVVLDWIVKLGLNLIFEVMGLPSCESRINSIQWDHLCSLLADHLVERYGHQVIGNWIFELWNEPDLKQYNIANFTLESYIEYAKSCMNGIRNKIPNVVIGGPAGLFKNVTHHKLCWGFLDECNALRNQCRIDYLSFHKKALPESLVLESLEMVSTIRREYPKLSFLPFFNSEADIMNGWWKPQRWRGDVRYAAAVTKVIHLFSSKRLQELFMGISNDNGFLNTYPSFFNQRTLLTRFNNTFHNATQFIKKPVYVATGMLGMAEKNLIKMDSSRKSSFSALPTINSCTDSSASSILLLNWGENSSVTSSSICHLNVTLPYSWGSAYFTLRIISNFLDHPRKIWNRYGRMRFPDPEVRELMRRSEGPFLISQGVSSKVLLLSFRFPSPSVGLLQICTKHLDKPDKIFGLKSFNISYSEVLLVWKDDFGTRCISTYEVEFSPDGFNDANGFRRVNKDDTILCSFQYVNDSGHNEEYIRGLYRVRAVNVWGIAGPYSSIHRYPTIL